MASSTSALLCFLFVLAAAAVSADAKPEYPMANATYIHLYTSNVTVYPVVSLNQSSTSTFGAIYVYDTPMTEGPEPSSKVLGRGQGMAVGVSLSDSSLLTSINMVFTEGKYNGSTLAMYGEVMGDGSGDRPIVGGSGLFRMARGYALSKITQTTPYYVVEFDIYVWTY